MRDAGAEPRSSQTCHGLYVCMYVLGSLSGMAWHGMIVGKGLLWQRNRLRSIIYLFYLAPLPLGR